MKRILFIITSLLFAVTIYAFPPTPPNSVSVTGLTDAASVAITGGNVTGITNLGTANLTVSGTVNATGTTWQGTPTWNQSTTGNAANAAALNGHADTYFQTSSANLTTLAGNNGANLTGVTATGLSGTPNISVANLTVSGVANVTGATWQGTPTWNQDTTGNAANAALLNNHADTYFQTALTALSNLSVGNLTVSGTANVTSWTGLGISDGVASTASNVAASSNAAKIAYDLANGKQTTGALGTLNVYKVSSFAWDGGGSAISTTNAKRCMKVQNAYAITGVTLDMDVASNSTFIVYAGAASNTTHTTTDLTNGNAINASAILSLTDNTLTGWSKAVNATDEVCANIITNSNATWATLNVWGTR